MSQMLVAAVFASTTIDASAHPNELKFEGTLVRLDEPSTKAPNGSRGHRILIPKEVAEKRYKTLIGMGVNYSDELDSHAPTKKVGVIKKAWIEGNAIKVSGVVWKKDFPDAEKDLKQKNLGMSFEASDVSVEDDEAPIWKITDLCFTGAAILYKASAAYFKTDALAASAMSTQFITKNNGGEQMATTKEKKQGKASVAASGEDKLVARLVSALTTVNKPIIEALNNLSASNEEVVKVVQQHIDAASEVEAKKGDDDEDDDDEEMESSEEVDAGEDEEEMESSADDEDEIEDEQENDSEEEDEPGHLNKSVKFPGNKGAKTSVSTKGNHNKKAKASEVKCGSETIESLAASLEDLRTQREADRETIEGLKKQLRIQKTQLKAAGERTDRRSVSLSAGAANLLTKEGIDVGTIVANGQKLTVGEIDACMAKANMSIPQRIALKSELVRANVMDEGFVKRQ